MLSVLSILNFPICTIIGAFSMLIVCILYGVDYLDVAPLLTILSVWGFLVCIGNPVGNIVTATGRTDLSFYYVIVRLFIVVPMTYIASLYSIIAVAYSVLIGELIIFFISWYMELWMTIRLSFFKYISSFIGIMIISVIFTVLGYWLMMYVSDGQFLLNTRIIMACVVITVAYLGIVAMVSKNRIKELVAKLR